MSELDRQLLNACRYGNASEVETKIRKGANVHFEDWADPFQCTPLSEASRRGKAGVVKVLLSMGADPNEPISYGITPLHLACEHGHCDVLQVLLTFGKNNHGNNNNSSKKNSKNSENNNNNNNRNELLPSKNKFENTNDKDNDTSVTTTNNNDSLNNINNNENENEFTAITININDNSYNTSNNNNEEKKSMDDTNDRHNNEKKEEEKAKGYHINPMPTEYLNHDTPLHLAAANDHSHICRMLIALGDNVDINTQNKTGDTALHLSVANNRFKTIEVLLQLGADLSIKNYAGLSVYSLAKAGKCKQSLKAMRPFIEKLKLQRNQDRERKLTEKLNKKLKASPNFLPKSGNASLNVTPNMSSMNSISHDIENRHNNSNNNNNNNNTIEDDDSKAITLETNDNNNNNNSINNNDNFLNTSGSSNTNTNSNNNSSKTNSNNLNLDQSDRLAYGYTFDNDNILNDDNDNEDDDGFVHVKASLSFASYAKRQSNIIFRHGWLTKQGEKVRSWKDRYFVLFSNGDLKYYTKQNISNDNQVLYYDPTSPKFNFLVNTNIVNAENYQENDNNNNNTVTTTTGTTNENHNNGNTIANENTENNQYLKPDMAGNMHKKRTFSPVSSEDVNTNESSLLYSTTLGSHDNGNLTMTIGTTTTTATTKQRLNSTLLSTPATIKNSSPIYNHYSNNYHQHKKSRSRKLKILHPKGKININDMIETQFLEFDDPGVFGFAVITSSRIWKFQAKSAAERKEWIASIHAVNYGVSPFDFRKLSFDISQTGDTTVFRHSKNSFLSDMTFHSESDANQNDYNNNKQKSQTVVQEGWIYKMGVPLISGLEQNYWQKRWITLYTNPARLIYAQYPTDYKEIQKTLNLNLDLDIKAPSYNLTDLSVQSIYDESNNSNNDGANQSNNSNSNSSLNDSNNNIHESWKLNNTNEFTNPLTSIFHTFAQNEEMRAKLANGTLYIKGQILISDISDMDYIQDKKLIRTKYRAPTIHVFTLTTPNRVWKFACQSKEEVQLWMQRIKFFIPNYQIKQMLDSKFQAFFEDLTKHDNNNINDDLIDDKNEHNNVTASKGRKNEISPHLGYESKNEDIDYMNATIHHSNNNNLNNNNDNDKDDDIDDNCMKPLSLTTAALAMASSSSSCTQSDSSPDTSHHYQQQTHNLNINTNVASINNNNDVNTNDSMKNEIKILASKNHHQPQHVQYLNNNGSYYASSSPQAFIGHRKSSSDPTNDRPHGHGKSHSQALISTPIRKVSGFLETIGLKEKYSIITRVNPRGPMADAQTFNTQVS